jgi:urease accessory protein
MTGTADPVSAKGSPAMNHSRSSSGWDYRNPKMGSAGGTPTALYRLLAWLSSGFPIGAFSYSHGLEAAVQSRAVHNRGTLHSWILAIVARGTGRIGADILRDAYRAAEAQDLRALSAANRRGLAYCATAELALETTLQGNAFIATCTAAWPDAFLENWVASWGVGRDPDSPMSAAERAPTAPRPNGAAFCYPAVVGAAAARAGIPLGDILVGYLQAQATNLVSAGLRLGIIGQTDGQCILATLEPSVVQAAAAALTRDPADSGTATVAVDLASMAHETQYTRLFRS